MNASSQKSSAFPEAIPTERAGERWSPLAWASSLRDYLAARLLAPVDNASVVVFRVVFGLLMLWEINRYFRYGWIDLLYVDPQFNFTYYGFGWVRPLPGVWMHGLYYLLAALAVCITLGLWYRFAMPLFFLCFTYTFLLEKSHFLNHLYLVCLISFLMIFIPANRALSVDAYRRPSLRSDTLPAWGLVLLAAQIGIAYFYGGLAKLYLDWLQGDPMRIWMANETDFPLLGRWFTEEWMVYLVSWSGLVFDLLVVPALLWPRTRWFAVVALVLFHRFNAGMFSIGIFPMFGTLSVILFLPPSLPRTIYNKIAGRKPARAKVSQAPATLSAARAGLLTRFTDRPFVERLTVILVLLYLAIQLVVPFRHWLYPGNTAWTDQGDRFAWRMMLVSKVGDISFVVRDPATGQTWDVDPDDYLIPSQRSDIVSQPDMILQFSHYLADLWAADGYEDVEVRAISSVSLNGRDPYPIVDPTVDLAAEELTPFNASWITSIEEMEREGPPPTWPQREPETGEASTGWRAG